MVSKNNVVLRNRRVQQASNELITSKFKLYKSGKFIVMAGVLGVGTLFGISTTVTSIHADEISTSTVMNVVTNTQQQVSTQPNSLELAQSDDQKNSNNSAAPTDTTSEQESVPGANTDNVQNYPSNNSQDLANNVTDTTKESDSTNPSNKTASENGFTVPDWATKQQATVTFVDTDNDDVAVDVESLRGDANKTIDGNSNSNISDLETKLVNQGYVIVDDSEKSITYDNDPNTIQHITIKLGHAITTTQQNKVITRTVYLYPVDKGIETYREQQVTYTRSVSKDAITRKETYGNWHSDNNVFPAVEAPVMNGYIAMHENENLPASTVPTPKDGPDDVNMDSWEYIHYQKLGNWVIEKPDGTETKIPYVNDDDNAFKIKTPSDDSIIIPYVKGYTLKTYGSNKVEQLDKNDVTKGYLPPVPDYPYVDQHLDYSSDLQNATWTFIDDLTGKVVYTWKQQGPSNSSILMGPMHLINAAQYEGYKVVSNDYTEGTMFDADSGVDQNYTIHLTHTTSPATKDTNKTVTRTIHPSIGKDVVQTIHFSRTGSVDNVTHDTTYGEWTSDTEDDTFGSVNLPIIDGYDEISVPAVKARPTDNDVHENVNYVKSMQNVNVLFVDETGNVVHRDEYQGRSGAAMKLQAASLFSTFNDKDVYTFVSSDLPSNSVFDFVNKSNQTYTIHVAHKTKWDVVPNTPITEQSKIGPALQAPINTPDGKPKNQTADNTKTPAEKFETPGSKRNVSINGGHNIVSSQAPNVLGIESQKEVVPLAIKGLTNPNPVQNSSWQSAKNVELPETDAQHKQSIVSQLVESLGAVLVSLGLLTAVLKKK